MIDLLGYEVTWPVDNDDERAIVATYWRVMRPSDRSLAFFLHLLGRDGGIVAQHDGLSAPADAWYAGDLLIQLHSLKIPSEMLETSDWLQLGLYDTETLERIAISEGPISDQQRVLLPFRKAD